MIVLRQTDKNFIIMKQRFFFFSCLLHLLRILKFLPIFFIKLKKKNNYLKRAHQKLFPLTDLKINLMFQRFRMVAFKFFFSSFIFESPKNLSSGGITTGKKVSRKRIKYLILNFHESLLTSG